MVGPDLARRRGELEEAAAGGVPVLGVCGGYQLLGHEYVSGPGTVVAGLGLLDAVTTVAGERLIGRVQGRASLWGEEFQIFGFENHGGRTQLGPAAVPLAGITLGGGNNGEDRTEGAVQGVVVGTYLHGPVLPANPRFADLLLERALRKRTGGAPLEPLDDSLEERARAHAATLAR